MGSNPHSAGTKRSESHCVSGGDGGTGRAERLTSMLNVVQRVRSSCTPASSLSVREFRCYGEIAKQHVRREGLLNRRALNHNRCARRDQHPRARGDGPAGSVGAAEGPPRNSTILVFTQPADAYGCRRPIFASRASSRSSRSRAFVLELLEVQRVGGAAIRKKSNRRARRRANQPRHDRRREVLLR